MFSSLPTRRPRRNRQNPVLRELTQETHLQPSHLIAPLFVAAEAALAGPIPAMPGVFRHSFETLATEMGCLQKLGIKAVNLFCVIPKERKNNTGSAAYTPDNLMQQAIRAIKRDYPDICVMADIALDPFTDHGHDGLLNAKGEVDNDSTLKVLAEMALLAAEAGADVVAPSDMMDGRVKYLRTALDRAGYFHVAILSYAAKYASAFYGPFREALGSTLKTGDKKGYQLNPANSREALLECQLDEEEGADLLLIKPALAYLDVLAKVRQATHLPVGAYHVSGEYAMVMAAAERGWIDADRVFLESLLSIRRAGADFILTYAAHRVAQLLR